VLISHKIALKTNNKQNTYFAKAAGVARFAYNWGLQAWTCQYEAWKSDNSLSKPSQLSLRRELNSIKRAQFPWMLEVTKNAPQMALIQLGQAFKNFFNKKSQYPTFRKKGINDRFSLTNDQFKIDNSRIHIPNLGWVRMREGLRFTGKIMSATISRVADKWFVSLTLDVAEQNMTAKTENQGIVGVDLGISTLATLSTGEIIPGVKAHTSLLKRLQLLSKRLSKKQKGSQNRKKLKMKLAKLHARIANIRIDALHKLTTSLTRRFTIIGIEDLNVRGMLKNHRLARSIADMSFYEFRRQLEYKAARGKGIVVVADRWFASSKLCSCCGYKHEDLTLSIRKWQCPNCHVQHDRDHNAAINLKNMAVGSTVTACGEESAGFNQKIKVKLASVKQEVNTIATYG
jgi:putative transposase